MSIQGSPNDHFTFGRFRFDASTGELWRDGHAVRIAPKPAQLLTLLLQSAGELVSRDRIESEVWGTQAIDLDRSVNFSIRQIRSALGDSADAPLYIETLPRRGYRFIAPVGSVPSAIAGTSDRTDVPTIKTAPTSGSAHGRRRWAAATVALVGVAAALSAPSIASVIEREPGTPDRGDALATIVVLPFEHLGDAPEDGYFAAGLSEELITTMARLDPARLSVIAPSSSRRAQTIDASDASIAERLSAGFILRGSVTPTDDGMRVAARLIDTSDETLLWADRYLVSAPATPALEYDIALRVADALSDHVALSAARPARPSAPNEAARAAYLEGRWLLSQGWGRVDDAIERLQVAVGHEPTYAAARTSLARGLTMRGRREEARHHLRTAIELDPRSAAAHAALGTDAMYALWDMDLARGHFEEALAVDPGNVLAHHPYSYFLSISGQHQEAISEMEEALRLDPVSPLVHGDVGRIYYRAGRFDEAMDRCQRTLDLQSDHQAALSCLINIHTLRGEPDQALVYAIRTMGAGREAAAAARALNARTPAEAMKDYFEQRLATLQQSAAQGNDVQVPIAQVLVFLERHAEAIEALETALHERSTILPQVPGDPCFAILRSYPRFMALVEAMGLGDAAA